MASASINPSTTFPVGTTLSVYLRSVFPAYQAPSGTPPGSAVTTADMTATGVTFTGLADATDYVATAEISGTYRYVGFRTANAAVSTAPSGAAGGVLGGTYPNPSFGADMATQAELDAVKVGAKFAQPFGDPWTALLAGGGGTILAETMPWQATASANTTLASARVRLMGGIVLPAGQAITGIGFICGSTAMSGATHAWASLIRASDRVYLRSSADDTTATWTAGTVRTYALSSPYTPSVDTPVWIGYVAVATTAPSLVGAAANGVVAAMTPIRTALGDAGLAAPPTDGTVHGVPAINTSAVYAWVY